MAGPLLSLERVSKVYRRGLLNPTPAFRLDVDRTFEGSQIVGVLGTNGVGNTTLFEMIAGSNVPTGGRVLVARWDIHRVRYRQRDRLDGSAGPGKSLSLTCWEHEHVVEAVQKRLDANPQAMRQRRETVEHPFGTMKAHMGATHFLTKTLPKVATEMALSVLAYNLTRVINIVGVKPLIAAMGA